MVCFELNSQKNNNINNNYTLILFADLEMKLCPSAKRYQKPTKALT